MGKNFSESEFLMNFSEDDPRWVEISVKDIFLGTIQRNSGSGWELFVGYDGTSIQTVVMIDGNFLGRGIGAVSCDGIFWEAM